MDNTLRHHFIEETREVENSMGHDLTKVKLNSTLIIKSIHTNDHAMRDFLFTLGCYEGQTITVISKLGSTYVVNINDARYSIDTELAKAIIV
jgi:ferrous iron transport protein A